MTLVFFDGEDEQNPLNGATISDVEQLSKVLRSLLSRTPFVCELRGENGYTLSIGIGEVANIQHAATDGKPPYLMAMMPEHAVSEGEISSLPGFLLGGTITPVSARYALPFSLAEKVAIEFLETGCRSKLVQWEEI